MRSVTSRVQLSHAARLRAGVFCTGLQRTAAELIAEALACMVCEALQYLRVRERYHPTGHARCSAEHLAAVSASGWSGKRTVLIAGPDNAAVKAAVRMLHGTQHTRRHNVSDDGRGARRVQVRCVWDEAACARQ